MTKRRNQKKIKSSQAMALLLLALVGSALYRYAVPASTASIQDIPAYNGSPYVTISDNVPTFTEQDWTTDSYEIYGALDALGRCTRAEACIGPDLMPSEDRESIQDVTPTRWVQESYDFISGQYLYNRSHLIGYQLTGENANACNLITGTRYLNVEGMLPFENMVADYLRGPTCWPKAFRWRLGPWRIRETASPFMCSATTYSPVWRLTMPLGRTGLERTHDGKSMEAL